MGKTNTRQDKARTRAMNARRKQAVKMNADRSVAFKKERIKKREHHARLDRELHEHLEAITPKPELKTEVKTLPFVGEDGTVHDVVGHEIIRHPRVSNLVKARVKTAATSASSYADAAHSEIDSVEWAPLYKEEKKNKVLTVLNPPGHTDAKIVRMFERKKAKRKSKMSSKALLRKQLKDVKHKLQSMPDSPYMSDILDHLLWTGNSKMRRTLKRYFEARPRPDTIPAMVYRVAKTRQRRNRAILDAVALTSDVWGDFECPYFISKTQYVFSKRLGRQVSPQFVEWYFASPRSAGAARWDRQAISHFCRRETPSQGRSEQNHRVSHCWRGRAPRGPASPPFVGARSPRSSCSPNVWCGSCHGQRDRGTQVSCGQDNRSL